METFLQKHADVVTGALTGFDRLVFRGTLRNIAYAAGLDKYLGVNGLLLKDFGKHAETVSNTLKAAGRRVAEAASRPVQYLQSPKTNKEQVALEIAARDQITKGLICILTSVEPCQTFEIRRDRETKHIHLQPARRKCLFMYHYAIHPVFGFMNARIQTWFPFTIQICLNGREWLSRSMNREGIGYARYDNCFPWIEDVGKAQELMDQQLSTDWPQQLGGIARYLNPAHGEIFNRFESSYYWSTYQCEVATDVMFEDPKKLAALYPSFVHHAITSFGSPDVLRFLGQKRRLNWHGDVHGKVVAEVTSSLKRRKEGVRVKHSVAGNSLKIYDKGGRLLRVETTINNSRDLRVYRPKEGGRPDDLDWRYLRKGIADLHRLSEVSRAANARYLDSLASVEDKTPLGELLRDVTRHARWKGKRVRALRPHAAEDSKLLEAISRGEFNITGFKNRDLRKLLYGEQSSADARRSAGRVTRQLRLLRAHGIIRKVPKSHRYLVTSKGRDICTALLAARAADVTKLTRAA